jgi:hypothetical protein
MHGKNCYEQQRTKKSDTEFLHRDEDSQNMAGSRKPRKQPCFKWAAPRTGMQSRKRAEVFDRLFYGKAPRFLIEFI